MARTRRSDRSMKVISLRLDADFLKKVTTIAEQYHRPRTNLIQMMLVRAFDAGLHLDNPKDQKAA